MVVFDVFPVDEYVAFSPMLDRAVLPYITKEFDVVIAAVETHELAYDPSLLQSRVEYIHIPIPDFAWPSLWQLYRAAKITLSAAKEGKRVLIHCFGGKGRSATLAAGYLVYRYGFSARRAVEVVRSIRRGAIEAVGQLGVLRSFEAALVLDELTLRNLYGNEAAGEALRLGGQLAEALKNSNLGAMWIAHSLVFKIVDRFRSTLTSQNTEFVEDIVLKVFDILDVSHGIASIDLDRKDDSYNLIVVCTSFIEYCESFVYNIAKTLSKILRTSIETEILYE
ncbi:putative protein-tyrosine phosphatase [Pyrodictium delaneyi]|uniref:Tyrosine specific protein phosphatases domain-containing protein n=1 Tax=Pyrodictium delaneyi TaxID=1273541 RepID=A0A0P0N4G0_9CREN|nr:dual specificity protein phosphatase family protein [Pyrodictium delaneyi]ALL01258.1 putative protein-tyrosine phosphatase [Pyrodictium delaneyi]OWJ55668.1 hypothetical protein Pdsh_02490 [Pyrodictium delaneyi]